MKQCCVIFACNDYELKYPEMVQRSVKSFKKFHPDIEVKLVNERVDTEFWVWRTEYVRDLFIKEGYTKVIMLGSDTITCSRLDEFLNDNTTSFLATSDYMCIPENFVQKCGYVQSVSRCKMEGKYINSDVSCFNNTKILDEIIKIMKTLNCHDNDAMNHANCNPILRNDIHIVDFPYFIKRFTYNLRGFGLVGSDCIKKDGRVSFGFDGDIISEISPLKNWNVINNRVYNHDGKHVKCIHLASYKDETLEFLFSENVCNWFKAISQN